MFAVVIDFVVFLEQVLISFDGLHAIGFIVHVLCVCGYEWNVCSIITTYPGSRSNKGFEGT